MLRSVNAITTQKAHHLGEYISENVDNNISMNLSLLYDIIKPLDQIDFIFKNIQFSLAQISGIHPDDIGLSIIYTTDRGKDWQWVHTKNIENDLPLEVLVNNKLTTVKNIIDSNVDLLFFPDKRIAITKKKYFSSKRDQPYNSVGSILCKDINIIDQKQLLPLRAILSISTYGKQLCEYDDLDSIRKIQYLILPTFEQRLKLELAFYFINNHMIKKSTQ